jgi:hypothetical protein
LSFKAQSDKKEAWFTGIKAGIKIKSEKTGSRPQGSILFKSPIKT